MLEYSLTVKRVGNFLPQIACLYIFQAEIRLSLAPLISLFGKINHKNSLTVNHLYTKFKSMFESSLVQ